MWKNTAKGRYHYKMMEQSPEYREHYNTMRMERYYRNAEVEKARAKEYYLLKKSRQKIRKIDSSV
jgi:hypothetical protein